MLFFTDLHLYKFKKNTSLNNCINLNYFMAIQNNCLWSYGYLSLCDVVQIIMKHLSRFGFFIYNKH